MKKKNCLGCNLYPGPSPPPPATHDIADLIKVCLYVFVCTIYGYCCFDQ